MRRRVDWGNAELAPGVLSRAQLRRKEKKERQKMRKDEEKTHSTHGHHSLDSPAVDDDSQEIAEDGVPSPPGKHQTHLQTPNGAGGSSGDHSVDSPAVDVDSQETAEDGVLSSPGKHQTHLQTPNGAGGSSGDHSVDSPAVDDDSQEIAKDGVLSPLSQHLTPSGAGGSSSPPSGEAAVPQIMQEMMEELVGMHKELQKQMTRTEKAVEQKLNNFEKGLSKHMTRKEAADKKLINFERGLQEKMATTEKALENKLINFEGELPKQMTMEKAVDQKLINFNDQLQEQMAGVEKTVEEKLTNFKGELLGQMKKMTNGALSALVKKEISENAESLREHKKKLINEAFNQLEKSVISKLEATIPKQIMDLGDQALWDALMFSMNTSVLPAFEQACRQMLMGVYVDPRTIQLTNFPHEKVEMPLELLRLVAEGKYDDAFTIAIQKCDARFVAWLCAQLDIRRILSLRPSCLRQGLLLSLCMLLTWGIDVGTHDKAASMMDLLTYLDLNDEAIAIHAKPFLLQIYNALVWLYHDTHDMISPAEEERLLDLITLTCELLES